MIKKTTIYLITQYQKFISKVLVYFLGGACRFTPTCSEYGKLALERYGIVKGSYLTLKRIIRCNPLSRVSFDPVP